MYSFTCSQCNSSSRKHMSKGMCNPCYQKAYKLVSPNYAERARQQKHDWYKRNITSSLQKQKRDELYFGGNREAALCRDDYQCVNCRTQNDLTVHHTDGQGRGSKTPNNSLENLETLCRSCHIKRHIADGTIPSAANRNRRKPSGKWSLKYELDACVGCNKSSIKHVARGLCKVCYEANKRKNCE